MGSSHPSTSSGIDIRFIRKLLNALLAGRLILGTNDLRFSIDASVLHDRSEQGDARSMAKLVPAAEFKINSGMWVEFALGLEAPLKDLKDAGIISQETLNTPSTRNKDSRAVIPIDRRKKDGTFGPSLRFLRERHRPGGRATAAPRLYFNVLR